MSYYSSVGLSNPVSVHKAQHSEDPGLTFDLPMDMSGPSQLPTNMTVDGYEVAPTFRYTSTGVRENLLSYTEDFENAAWIKVAGVTVSDGYTSPFGSGTATLISSSASGHQAITTNGMVIPIHAGEIYTVSMYLKAENIDWVFLHLANGINGGVYFNLSDGLVGSTSAAGIVSSRIEAIGPDWFRVSMSVNITSGYIGFSLYLAESDGDYNLASAPGDAIYIYAPQINSGPLIPYYDAGKTSAGPNRKWFSDVGPDLDYAGSGNDILIKPSPFTDGAPVIKFNSGKCFSAVLGAGPGTNDVAIEYVGFNDSSGGGVLLEWSEGAAGTPRIEINTTRSATQVYIRGFLGSPGGSASTYGCRGSNGDNLYHFIEFYDNSQLTSQTTGLIQYANGAADSYSLPGATNDIDVNMNTSSRITISGRYNYTSTDDSGVVAIAIHSSANWYPGGTDNTTVWKETIKRRSAQVMGVYPATAVGDKTPLVATRTSNNSFLDIQDDSGYRTLHQVAKGWMRICKRPDNNDKLISGLLSEKYATQKLPYTDDMINDWGGHATISKQDGYETFQPHLEAQVCTLISTGNTNAECAVYYPNITPSGDGWTSCWAKKGNGEADWFALRLSTVTSGIVVQYFDLVNGVIGTGTTDVLDAFIEDWGSGWYRCCMKHENAKTGYIYLHPCAADNSVWITPSSIGVELISLVFPQVINNSDGPTSFILNTGTGGVTRAVDILEYTPIDNYAPITGYTIDADILKYPAAHANSIAGPWGLSRTTSYHGIRVYCNGPDGELIFRVENESDTTLWAAHTSSDVSDGYVHNIRGSWEANSQEMYIDGNLDASNTLSDGPHSDINYLSVGKDRSPSAIEFDGLVSNFKIYNKVK